MSANGQFFVGAHMPVSLQKTTQIISGIAVIIARIAYASTNKTQKSLELRWDSFCYPRVDMPQVHVCIVAVLLPVLLVPKPVGGHWRTALGDRCVEIKRSFQWCSQFWQSLEEGARKQCSECGTGLY